MNPPVLQLPLDLTGTAVTNKVTAELHSIAASGSRAFVTVRGPFYTSYGMALRNKATGAVLQPDVDYRPVHMFLEASLRAGQEVCSVILILPTCHASEVEFDYQGIGGDYSTSASEIQQMIDALDLDNRTVYWGDLIGVPEYFPPTAHLHDIGDLYGFEYLVTVLEQIRRAILLGDQAAFDEIRQYVDLQDAALRSQFAIFQALLDDHVTDISNPHNVTKAQVGLSLVQNYSIATQAEAQAGNANNLYMTPLRVKDAVIALAGNALNAHIARLDNPHNVTKTQLGLSDVVNYGLATTEQAQAGSGNAYMTASLTGAAITALALAPLNAHIARDNNPHNVTATQVGLGSLQNFDLATQAEAETGTSNVKYMTPLRSAQAISKLALVPLNAHISRSDNPHSVTKAQVGLDNVINYGLASIGQAQAGSGNAYMTASLTNAAITALALAPLNAHISNNANPHVVTKAQVGLGNVDDFGTASTAQANAGTATNLFLTPAGAKSLINLLAGAALNAHISNNANPHNVTKSQVGLANVENSKQVRNIGSNDLSMKWSGSEIQISVDVTQMGRVHTTSQPDPNIAAHANRTNNPHAVNSSDIGLGSVYNYGIATQAEAEAGSSNSVYMTPLRTAQAIQVQAINPLTALINQRVVTGSNGALNTLTIGNNAGYLYTATGNGLGVRANGNKYFEFSEDGNFKVNNGKVISAGGFQPSDRRLKKTVRKANARPLWRSVGYKSFVLKDTGEHQTGTIAQDMLAVAPDRVIDFQYGINRKVTRYAVDYTMAAFEMSYAAGVEIDELKKQVVRQDVLLAQLSARLAKLEVNT